MTDPLHDPYAPPTSAEEGPPTTLGPWLTVLMVLQTIAMIVTVVWFFGYEARAQAADLAAPDWSFFARGAFGVSMAFACIGVLRKKKNALLAYFGLSAFSLLLNLARGVSAPIAIVAAVAMPALVGLLVRKRMHLFQ